MIKRLSDVTMYCKGTDEAIVREVAEIKAKLNEIIAVCNVLHPDTVVEMAMGDDIGADQPHLDA